MMSAKAGNCMAPGFDGYQIRKSVKKWSESWQGGLDMAYYVTGNAGNGKYYYGTAVYDYLSALILLDEAKRFMPGENWAIKSYKV